MNIANKTFIVTGGGSGIGRALALELLQKHATVIALDIHDDALQETKKLAGEAGERVFLYVANIGERETIEKVIAQILVEHPEVDGIVNNAGIIQPFVRVNDLDVESIERVMRVNFFGGLYITKALLPTLLKRPEACIINVSSMGGFLPVPGQSVYGASKAAVKLLTEGLYAELQDTSVHVSVVFPGAINTNITKNSGVSMPENLDAASAEKAKKMASQTTSAQVAAQTIVKGIEKNQLRIYIGSDSKMMNALYRIAPTFATRFIAKQMKSLLP